jgi:hypothetical protein
MIADCPVVSSMTGAIYLLSDCLTEISSTGRVMTERGTYAKQNEAQECGNSREFGIVAHDSQGSG